MTETVCMRMRQGREEDSQSNLSRVPFHRYGAPAMSWEAPGRTSQHLSISSPSPTAIKYTFSSRTSEPSRLFALLRHALRIIIASYTLLATIAKFQIDFYENLSETIEALLQLSLLDSLLHLIMQSVPWWLLSLTSLITLYFCVRRDHTGEESLLVLQGLGVQTSTTSSYFFLSPTTTFIPATQIQEIVIHEAFKGFEVRFFLAIIVTGAAEVVVVFPTLLPKRLDLEVVWRGSRKCLYADTK